VVWRVFQRVVEEEEEEGREWDWRWWYVGGFVRSGFRGRKNGCGCGVDVLVRIASRMDWLLLLLLLVLYEASDLVVAATALSHAAAAAVGRKAICSAHGSRAGIGMREFDPGLW
jgi:hypothetical protein